MTIEEYIDKINGTGYSCVWEAEDDLELDYYKRWIEPDIHRHYITDIVVYKIGDRYLGIWGLVYKNDDYAEWGDYCIDCEAFEVEEVPTTTFRIKS